MTLDQIRRNWESAWKDSKDATEVKRLFPELLERIERAIEVLRPATDDSYLTCSGSCVTTAKEALTALEAL